MFRLILALIYMAGAIVGFLASLAMSIIITLAGIVLIPIAFLIATFSSKDEDLKQYEKDE